MKNLKHRKVRVSEQTIRQWTIKFNDGWDWAIVSIDPTGVFSCQSSYGDYAYTWRGYGHCFFAFLNRLDCGYFMGKCLGRRWREFNLDASKAELCAIIWEDWKPPEKGQWWESDLYEHLARKMKIGAYAQYSGYYSDEKYARTQIREHMRELFKEIHDYEGGEGGWYNFVNDLDLHGYYGWDDGPPNVEKNNREAEMFWEVVWPLIKSHILKPNMKKDLQVVA